MSDEKKLEVHDQRRKAYTRVIAIRQVTFECAECHRKITIDQYPGPKPIICLDCWPEYRRRKKTEAQRRRRARLRGG